MTWLDDIGIDFNLTDPQGDYLTTDNFDVFNPTPDSPTFFGGSLIGNTPGEQIDFTLGGGAGDLSFLSGGDTSGQGWLSNAFDWLSNAFDSRTTKLLGSLALPAAALAGGHLLGNLAGSGARSQLRDFTRDQQRLMRDARDLFLRTAGEPSDVEAILRELQATLSPGIQRILEQERQGERQIDEGLIAAGVDIGSPAVDLKARLRENTNRDISDLIARAVADERRLRLGARSQDLANAIAAGDAAARTGVAGAQVANQAAGQAGGAAMNALLLAAILGSEGGLLG